MIRFCDIEVCTAHIGEVTRELLLDFFEQNHLWDIVVIYDENNEFYGTLDREEVLKNIKLESAICLDKLTLDEHIFENAKERFKKLHHKKLLPVFNQSGNLEYFCFDDQDFRYDQVLGFYKVLNNFEDRIDFVKYIAPEAKRIHIHGFNEAAFELYKVAKRHKVNILVTGELWKKVGIHNELCYEVKIDAKNTIHIYAESFIGIIYDDVTFRRKMQNVGENFLPIIKAGINLGQRALEKLVNELDDSIPICLCEIPAVMPFDTEWSRAFNQVRDVHNKIQGYADYESEAEKKAVRDIYGLTGYPLEQRLNENLVISIDDNINGMSYLQNRLRHRIYIIGPCIIRGYCVPDYKTLSYAIQQKVSSDEYEVVKIAISKIDWILLDKLKELPIRQGDILLFISEVDSFSQIKEVNNVTNLDLSLCYQQMDCEKPYFADHPIHVNANGHKVLADYIYQNYLKRAICEKKNCSTQYIQKGEIINLSLREKIKEYVAGYRNNSIARNNIGAIIMNCNPFTLGHQYLIEIASKMVSTLYIFVVEENRSEFSFEDRFALVKKGTKAFENVIVVPSGQFVLSYSTLPSYFEKETVNDVQIDASSDIEIFARYIAPEFGITVRFAGEEPIDNITRQYNEQMRKILPQFGIGFIEIPRLANQNEVISASRVRKAIKLNEWDKIKQMIPQTTYEYLRNRKQI